jgi:hypothetical protein
MSMKSFLPAAAALLLASPVLAQTSQPVSAPTGQKSLAATMNVYVFPAQGQAPDQQSKDEAECYTWAVTNTGTDPFELQKQTEEQKKKAAEAEKQAQQAGKGAGAKGAVGGAAAGALIGAIAGDAGKGAAIGAGAGLIAGRRRGKSAEAQAEAKAEAQAQQAKQSAATQMDAFRKAFSVCLEAKKYMVKY